MPFWKVIAAPPGTPFYAAGDGMIEVAGQVLDLCDAETKLIPGHGPVATPSDLLAYRGMLAGVREKLDALLDTTQDLKEIVAAKPTAPWDAKWGGGFLAPDPWVRIVTGVLQEDRKRRPSKDWHKRGYR